MSVCCECYVLSGRSLGDALNTRPEESYRLRCVVVCDLETSRMRRPWPALGHSATGVGKQSVNVARPNFIQFTALFFWDMAPRRSAFETSGTDYSVTWCHIPEEQSLQPHHREIHKIRKNTMMNVVLSIRYSYFILLHHSATLESWPFAHHDGIWASECSSPISMGVSGQLHSSNTSHRGKMLPLPTMIVFWPQSLSGPFGEGKGLLSLTGFESQLLGRPPCILFTTLTALSRLVRRAKFLLREMLHVICSSIERREPTLLEHRIIKDVFRQYCWSRWRDHTK